MKKIIIALLLFFVSSVSANEIPTLVIFGATGDLSAKKLFPAVYNLAQEGEQYTFVGVGRRPLEQSSFHQMVLDSLKGNPEALPFIQENFSYFQTAFEDEEGYDRLQQYLGENKQVLFYLATEPSYFPTIIRNLKRTGALEDRDDFWKRVIIEKPFGYDLASAERLHEEISQYLNSKQMYLIDHYLGKEGVLNILPLRNEEIEPLWNQEHIESVEIHLAEKIGIGTRGIFWEGTGLLRDVVQNHVIQMLALIAMEKPISDSRIHEEKINVLNAIRPLSMADVIRAQYTAGIVDGENVKGYLEEQDVASDSQTETFVAARMFIDNERWSGVPFIVRAGKRLSKQSTEIFINFKDQRQLYIRIQPNSAITFPGIDFVQPNPTAKEAYENLIQAAMKGDRSLFVDIEEIFASWRLFTPILQSWQNSQELLEQYEAGSFPANHFK